MAQAARPSSTLPSVPGLFSASIRRDHGMSPRIIHIPLSGGDRKAQAKGIRLAFDPAAAVWSVRIAAALVPLNGHRRIRRQPNFVDRSFVGFFLPGKE
jgi:hypothetical protein